MVRLQSENLFFYSWHSLWLTVWSQAHKNLSKSSGCAAEGGLWYLPRHRGLQESITCSTTLHCSWNEGTSAGEIWTDTAEATKGLYSQTEFTVKSTLTNMFVERRRKGTLCSAEEWMGGYIQNIRFLSVGSSFHHFSTERLRVWKHMQPVATTPCSPISLALCSCKQERLHTHILSQGVRFHKLHVALQENVLSSTKIKQATSQTR